MKTLSSLKRIVDPVFSELGFTLKILGKSDYSFVNSVNSRIISVNFEKLKPHKLRIIYQVRGKAFFTLPLKSFDPQFCPVSRMVYTSQDELDLYLKEIANQSVKIVFPYLDAMETNYVEPSFEMSQQLSNNINLRTKRFSQRWGISDSCNLDNLKRMDAVMESMKTSPSQRMVEFEKNAQEVLDLAACYGRWKAIDSGVPIKWGWHKFASVNSWYMVESIQYEPLERVLQAWNFGSEVAAFSLQGYHSKVEQ